MAGHHRRTREQGFKKRRAVRGEKYRRIGKAVDDHGLSKAAQRFYQENAHREIENPETRE